MPAALITGVGRRRGIGAAIARGLAADGWDLALSFHADYDERVLGDASDVELLVDELRAAQTETPTIVLVPGNLEDPAQPAATVSRAIESVGPLSALVMSHCESVDSSILTTTVESFDRHYAVNLRASWLLMKAFAEQQPCPGGQIIALTSDHTVDNVPYGSTKGALDRLVIAATHELKHLGIWSNVINPGPIDTGWMDDAIRAAVAAQTPVGRLGEASSVSDLVRFLVSPAGSWIRGQLLMSNGGFATP